ISHYAARRVPDRYGSVPTTLLQHFLPITCHAFAGCDQLPELAQVMMPVALACPRPENFQQVGAQILRLCRDVFGVRVPERSKVGVEALVLTGPRVTAPRPAERQRVQ